MSLKVGDQAPEFTLPDQDGHSVSLSSFIGERVIIYFYPKDNTPGCIKEACNFRDRWPSFQAKNIKLIGISKDSDKSHLKFIAKYQLPFTLLTDYEPCPVATAYESYGLKKFMGKEYMGMFRKTFVIDPSGKIEFAYHKVKAASMADDLLLDLELN